MPGFGMLRMLILALVVLVAAVYSCTAASDGRGDFAELVDRLSAVGEPVGVCSPLQEIGRASCRERV